ncbi:MAG: peptide ABC transporter substrate-binding protein [Chloroflexota bacterium]|nr:peptide ABC transporter substrate-binding protein [Chloroflexota bacterium]
MEAEERREAIARNWSDLTRRGLLGRAGTSAAGATALTLAGSPFSAALAAPATQAPGGTLRFYDAAEPDTIDPQKASFLTEIDKIMRVFRNLLQNDKSGQLVPDQAESLPVVEEGGRVLTFTLKPGLTYSDGRPLTAADFEYGWKRHLDPGVAGQYAFTGYVIEGAEAYNTADTRATPAAQLQALRDAIGVRALNENTIQFRLTTAAPWFLSVLATWCGVPTRRDLVEQGGDNWTEPATYIGNGPYILTEWEHQSRMHFRANPRFQPAPPPIPDIEYAQINEPAVAFAAYLNDELDFVAVQREDKPRVDGDPNLAAQFHQFPGSGTYYIGFNTKLPPFDNQKVRAAFSFALDRSGFVRNILGGQGIPARQFIPPNFPGHFQFELEEQTFNPTIGQRLLNEAGFGGGRGLPPIKFGYSSNARSKTRIEAVASQLKQSLGVDVQPDPVEARAYTALLKNQQTVPQMYLLGWFQDYPDPQNWYSTVFNGKSTVSHTGWQNPEFDRLTNEADVELDSVRRTEMYRQAAQILLNDAPVAFLWHSVAWLLVKPRVQGYREDPLEYFTGEHDLYNLRLTQ